jgi:hypothetical protein
MRTLLILGVLVFLASTNEACAASPVPEVKTWTFESDAIDAPPAGFAFAKTDGGRMGRWVVRASADAPSGERVLAQTDDDRTDGRFAVAIANEPKLRDVRASVACKPISGRVDQACGLVFRYRDADNYYLTRANALEGNVRLYFVKDGQRKQIASWSGTVKSGAWSTLGAEARGDHLVVSWNGKAVIDTHDATFDAAGQVGLWTKADSITEFDDLTVTPIE